MFTIHTSEDGFASGSKDGSVILWDSDFKPITKIDMLNSVVGYKGEVQYSSLHKTYQTISWMSLAL